MRLAVLLSSAAMGAAVLLPLGAANAQTPFDWDGFYAGVHGGSFNGMIHIDSDVTELGHLDGFVGGGLFGYDFKSLFAAPWRLGVEGDAGVGDFIGHGITTGPVDAVSDVFTYDFEWDAHLRAMLGYTIGNFTPFIAGGAAFAEVHLSEGSSLSGGGGTFGGFYTGGTIGGGVDAQLAPGVLGRLEALYDVYQPKSYDDGDYKVHLTAWTFRAAAIFQLP